MRLLKRRWGRYLSARGLAIRRADRARDRGNSGLAATRYRKIVEHWGADAGLLMQLGNALKDSGAFGEAERRYGEALAITPNDGDIYLQLGHLMKRSGQVNRAVEFYTRSKALDPRRDDAERELELLLIEALPEATIVAKPIEEPVSMIGDPGMPPASGIVHLRLAARVRVRRG